MVNTKHSALIALLVAISLGHGFGQTISRGTTGLAFLKLGAGGRAAAMGEAFIASVDDATSVYWNPAGLSFMTTSEVAFTHTEWIQDISHEFLGFAFPLLRGAIGVSLYSTNVGGIERRDRPSEQPLGKVQAHDVAFGLSYGYAFTSALRGGLTVKYLYEKIFIESASGYAFDFGFNLQPFQRQLRLALVVQNIGSMGNLDSEGIELPRTVRGGGSFFWALESLGGGILVEVDAVKVLRSDLRANFGLEVQMKERISFRLGYQSGLEDRNFGGGLGLHFRRYRLDYGYTPFSSSLGASHRFSFALRL